MSQLQLDRHGFLKDHPQVQHCLSPNYAARPTHLAPCLLVLHNISLPPYQYGGPYIEQLFCNCLNPEQHPYFAGIAQLRVSSHFLIRREGLIVQFVSTEQAAWHAGASDFEGMGPCNPYSIGIELEGCDFEAFTPVQYQQAAALTAILKVRYPLRAVRGHEHIAPVRKTDPGPFFDWAHYCQLAAWSRRQAPAF
ncbi:1,6-anhydro-N-acetylmuramyl-L-alanine amidase AmpD [Brackiella oedipodis]|uniref:1,6-anhydro-N-acetylmuramyl-L-alanine amidase AmpD n=1 Tax=Brackiella oedipodis TaxID=124225 RepID=UPI00048D4592|nr:1,6-anhydro-N-acetylmuramyl-L-alanine amidase AmpD [Brackiella oedipodis]